MKQKKKKSKFFSSKNTQQKILKQKSPRKKIHEKIHLQTISSKNVDLKNKKKTNHFESNFRNVRFSFLTFQIHEKSSVLFRF
jgi:hypothetical protein